MKELTGSSLSDKAHSQLGLVLSRDWNQLAQLLIHEQPYVSKPESHVPEDELQNLLRAMDGYKNIFFVSIETTSIKNGEETYPVYVGRYELRADLAAKEKATQDAAIFVEYRVP